MIDRVRKTEEELVVSRLPKMRLVAIDPSLTASGWALFHLHSGKILRSGVLAPPGPPRRLAERLQILHEHVDELFAELNLGADDYLVCEGPAPLVLNPQSAVKVEGVRGVFESIARSRRVMVPGRLNPRTIHSELLGMRGKQLPRAQVKSWARETANRMFGNDLRESMQPDGKVQAKIPQDIVDAALIGVVALTRIQFALKTGVDLYSIFTSDARRSNSRGKGSGYAGWREANILKIP